MSALGWLRGFQVLLLGAVLSAVCLLGWTVEFVYAETASETTSTADSSSSSDGINSALKQSWGSYKMEWGENQYRGKDVAEEEETIAESTDAVEDSQETKLTREPSQSLRSGTSDEDASNGSSLRSFEGEHQEATFSQSAPDPSVSAETP